MARTKRCVNTLYRLEINRSFYMQVMPCFVYRQPAPDPGKIVQRQPAINNKLAPKPTPKTNPNSTLTLT